MSDTPTRANTPDDPSVEAMQEEYQVVEPPKPDEERLIDESVPDPEAPLVETPAGDDDVPVDPIVGDDAD